MITSASPPKPSSAPPAQPPASRATLPFTLISPFAAVTSAMPTSSGTSALRVGSNTDASAAWAAITAYTTVTPGSARSGSATTASPQHTPNSTARRFHRSATTPATGLSSTAGSRPSTMLSAVVAAEPVRWKT
ncbi:hypothetical protein DV36_19655 [Amycolatopsis mediterranei]|nr:hypothetical protein DV36_19655 [Amycolatopsis mediterranei]